MSDTKDLKPKTAGAVGCGAGFETTVSDTESEVVSDTERAMVSDTEHDTERRELIGMPKRPLLSWPL